MNISGSFTNSGRMDQRCWADRRLEKDGGSSDPPPPYTRWQGNFFSSPDMCSSCSLASSGLLGEFFSDRFMLLLWGLFIFSAPLCGDCLADRGTSHSALYYEKEPRFPTRLNSNVAFLFLYSMTLYYFRLGTFEAPCFLRSQDSHMQFHCCSACHLLALSLDGLFSAVRRVTA